MSHDRSLPYLVGGLLGATVGLIALVVLLVRAFSPVFSSPQEGRVEPAAHLIGVSASSGGAFPVAVEDSISAGRGNAIVQASRRASPAVVGITVIYDRFSRVPANPLQQFFSGRGFRQGGVIRQPYQKLGSGVIIDPRGYIVTNNHVLGDSKDARIFLTLGDGRQYRAEVVGRAPSFDLALLRFSEAVEDLPVAVLGDSDRLEPGQWAIAIGAPYRYLLDDPALTITVGVISALHRDLEPGQGSAVNYLDMIQTDAAITQGNSGGALVNSRGEVIGINTFIIRSRGGGNLGAGFAVPINRVRWVMDEILQYGELRPRFAGFHGAVLDRRLRYLLQLDDSMTGLFVGEVWAGSPAEKAGLEPGDVIRAIDGRPILRKIDFNRTILEARVGSRLHLSVQRGDEIFDTDLTLAERPRPKPSSQGP